MPRRPPPHGNLTAALVAVSVLELVVNRWLGHLFTVPTCHTTLGCLALRLGPFLLYLTGTLATVVVAGGVGGHLWRGELFPRAMGVTTGGHILATVRLVAIGALTLVFVLLLDLSLVLGHVPPQYGTHVMTSFGFVVAMVALAFMVTESVGARARVGVVLFVLPPVLHVAAFVATQAPWWRSWWLKADQLTSLGEIVLIVAAATSPLTLVPGRLKPMAPALGLAAGLTTFFLVASVGRPDLVQALGLYGVHIDLPRTWSVMGLGYSLGLFGFTVTLVTLLLGAGAERLAGLGLALVALGGYQTASPVELALTLAGSLALATGLTRAAGAPRDQSAFISTEAWRRLLGAIGGQMKDGSGAETSASLAVEVAPGEAPGADRAIVRTTRRGRPIALVARRARHALEDLTVTVGAPPPDTAPDATIESHESWLARRPEARPSAARIKTDDPAFDRKWGVYGHAPLGDRSLRRRVLAQGDATIKLWSGLAAELSVSTHPLDGVNGADGRQRDPLRNVIDAVDLLGDLVEASAASTSRPGPEPSAPPVPS